LSVNDFFGSANPIVYQALRLFFVDSETKTWNIDPNFLGTRDKGRIAKGRNRSVIIVHLYGMPAQMDAYHGLLVPDRDTFIEDAAEALGFNI
jgi:dTDP-4-amino-4,6-dideoxygalactose transaminase